MEIIEKIPQYTTPDWVLIVFLCGIGMAFVTFITKDTEWVSLIAIILTLIILFVSIVGFCITRNTVYSHDEYVVKLTDMPAQEFNDKYVITKRFEYSDAIQIKERN